MIAEQRLDAQHASEWQGEWAAAVWNLAGWSALWSAVQAVGDITAAGYVQRRAWFCTVQRLPAEAGGLYLAGVWGYARHQHLCIVGYGDSAFVAYRRALEILQAHVTARTTIPF